MLLEDPVHLLGDDDFGGDVFAVSEALERQVDVLEDVEIDPVKRQRLEREAALAAMGTDVVGVDRNPCRWHLHRREAVLGQQDEVGRRLAAVFVHRAQDAAVDVLADERRRELFVDQRPAVARRPEEMPNPVARDVERAR